MAANDVRVLKGIPPKHYGAMIWLFRCTFPEIIAPVFGSAGRCARLLQRALRSDRVLTAIWGDRLVGFAGLHYSGREWFDPSLRQLVRTMGWNTLRVVAMGIILVKRPKPDALHLDTLAVHPDLRGQGIGTQLMEAVELLAQSEGKKRVTLEVEDINSRAKQLYERAGFVEKRFARLPWPWRAAFEFSGSYCMSKNVAHAELGTYSEESSSTI